MKLSIEEKIILLTVGIKAYFSKYGLLIIAGLVSFIMPLVPSLIFVGAISVFDFITGVMKARKTGTVSSRRMVQKVYAVASYFIAILIAHFMEHYFGGQIPFVKVIVAIIALTEIQSVRENIKEITGVDVLKPITDFLSKKKNDDNKQIYKH